MRPQVVAGVPPKADDGLCLFEQVENLLFQTLVIQLLGGIRLLARVMPLSGSGLLRAPARRQHRLPHAPLLPSLFLKFLYFRSVLYIRTLQS